jgi:hypothetical protein
MRLAGVTAALNWQNDDPCRGPDDGSSTRTCVALLARSAITMNKPMSRSKTLKSLWDLRGFLWDVSAREHKANQLLVTGYRTIAAVRMHGRRWGTISHARPIV